jgi:hypothetical protein
MILYGCFDQQISETVRKISERRVTTLTLSHLSLRGAERRSNLHSTLKDFGDCFVAKKRSSQ